MSMEISRCVALVEAAKYLEECRDMSEVTTLLARLDAKGFLNATDEDEESPMYRRTPESSAFEPGRPVVVVAGLGAARGGGGQGARAGVSPGCWSRRCRRCRPGFDLSSPPYTRQVHEHCQKLCLERLGKDVDSHSTSAA
jgi:hypothetical protein